MQASNNNRTRVGKAIVNYITDFNDIAEETYYLEQKVYEWQKKIERNKKRMSEQLGRRGNVLVEIDENTKFSVIKVVKPNIEFMADQLRNSLDKKRYKKVTDKLVSVKDLDGLIKLLKGYGVAPSEFKRFIVTTEVPNNDMIDHFVDIGEIKIEELQGCYKAEFEEEIKVRKVK